MELSLRLVVCLAVAALFGCGGPPAPQPDKAAAGRAALERGTKALDAKDYATADKELSFAIEQGIGYSPDEYIDLVGKRVVAWIEVGKLDEAQTEIDRLDAGGADVDQVWLLRGRLADKRGDKTAAQSAYAAAKKANPSVKLPK